MASSPVAAPAGGNDQTGMLHLLEPSRRAFMVVSEPLPRTPPYLPRSPRSRFIGARDEGQADRGVI
jgi:hypothetical protein